MACQGNHQDGNNEQKGLKNLPQVTIVIVPFPSQSHLIQLLYFSHLLASSYQIPVHYVGSTTHNRQAKLHHHRNYYSNSGNLNIHFHDFQLPDQNSNFSSFLDYILPAIYNLREPVSQLLHELSTKFRRVVVVHDSLMSSVVQDLKSIPNAEAYSFHPFSAFSRFFSIWETRTVDKRPFQFDSDHIIPFSQGSNSLKFADFINRQFKLSKTFESGRLYNTSRVIEGKYVQLLERLTSKAKTKHFAIGPLNPIEVVESRNGRHKCLEWLDRQQKDSVIYISFGTTTSMSDEQTRELAVGLGKSGQKFIWVLRNADHDHNRGIRLAQVLEGYNEDQGMLVNWAPQLEILAHPSTGAFMSHCGWGSCIESLSMGVPIVAWPMHSDQPKNSVLLTQVLKVGLHIREWVDRAKVVTSSMVADVVRRLLMTNEGVEMRRRARALGSALRESLALGGASHLEMDSFVACICRDGSHEYKGVPAETVASSMIQKPIHKMSCM